MTNSDNSRISIDSQNSSSASSSQDSSSRRDGVPKAVQERGYKILERLGSGAYATVYRASSDKMPGVPMACKWFDLTDRGQEVWREKCLKSEMKIMMKLKHPNIIKAYDVVKTRKMAFIFMAFAPNGSIGEYLEKTGKPIDEKLAKKWFRDIISAVAHMHSKGVAHRDIKPDNFLLDESNRALVSDFGFSCMQLDTERLMKGTNCGTDVYKAPELLTLPEGHVYDAKKTDIFSLGVSLFEMLNYVKPFGDSIDQNDSKALSSYVRKQKTRKYDFNRNVKLSKNVLNLLELHLEPDPNKRTPLQALLKHKWFESN